MSMSLRTPGVVILVIALGCTAITFGFFDNYPAFVDGHRDPPLAGVAGSAFLLLLAVAPILWVVALVGRDQGLLAALEVHLALLGMLFVIIMIVDTPGHSSPGDVLRGPILFGLFVVLVIEAIVVAIAAVYMKPPPTEQLCLRLAGPRLAVALLGGWIVGVLAWSSMLPSRVIAAAEAAAGGLPYCIDVDGRPARNGFDLGAVSMRATNSGGWTFSFHALLVIGATADRRYMNWSYRSGGFVAVSDSARRNLHLDEQARCTPVAHFARDW